MDVVVTPGTGLVQVSVDAPEYAWTGTAGASSSTETDGATVRTNLARLPIPKVVGTVVANVTGGAFATSVETRQTDGVKFARCLVTSPPSGFVNLTQDYPSWDYGPLVTPGTTVTCSFDAIASVAGPWAVQLVFYNAAHASVGTGTGVPVALTPGQWARLSHTMVVPAGAESVRVVMRSETPTMVFGDYLGMTRLLCEVAPGPGDYFDGDTHLVVTRTDAYGTNPVTVDPGAGSQVIEDRACSVEGTDVVYTVTVGEATVTTDPVSVPGAWLSTAATMVGPLDAVTPDSSQDGDMVLWPLGASAPIGVLRPLGSRTGTLDLVRAGDAAAKAVRDLYGETIPATLRSGTDYLTHRATRVDQRLDRMTAGGPVWHVLVDYYEVAS